MLSVNARSRKFRENPKLLLYGECVAEEWPNILAEFSKGFVSLPVCLERDHMNMVGFKLLSMIKLGGVKTVWVLTTDGSPHCVQLHMVVEEINRMIDDLSEVKHYVISKGKAYEVDAECIKIARHLLKIQKLKERVKS